MATIKSISVEPNLETLRQHYGLSWSKAANLGMELLLIQEGEDIKSASGNIWLLKVQKLQGVIQRLNQELINTKEAMLK